MIDGKVFALLDPGETATSAAQFAAMPDVDGLAYRERWSKMEPSAGTYNWSTLDAIADVARQAGKQLTLHVAADSPTWLTNLGMQRYSYNDPILGTGSAPVPWDGIYLSRHATLMRALAEHVLARGDAALVSVVSIGAPVSEMSLLTCANGMLGDSITYDRSRYLDAWASAISATDDAFSDPAFNHTHLVVSAPVTEICRPDGDGSAFFAALMNETLAAHSRLGVFMADLNAQGSARLNQVGTNTQAMLALHFQTIWSYNNDPGNRFKGTLRDAVCYSRNQGARYVEIYKADLLSTADADKTAITAARTGAGC